MSSLSIVLCSVTLIGASPSFGQDAAASATTQADVSPADTAFAPLKSMMDNLVQSLRNAGRVRPQDEGALRFVRDKAADFSKQFPGDPRGLAIELQISMWLNENDLVDDLFSRLAAARPGDEQIPLGQATFLINHNRFTRAAEVIQAAKFDPSKTPQAYLLLSDALFADQKFKEAFEALKAIPTETLDRDVFVKVQVDEKVKQRESYEATWMIEEAVRAAEAAANDLPLATIKTPRGEINIELFENQAPNTVANFIALAEKEFYNGTKFHRVIPNFMAQGGDPFSRDGATGTPGMGDPGYYIPDEIGREDARKHFTGSLAMAKTAAPNTGGCQFYLTFTPTPHLNGIHTVFGRVVNGWDIIRSLQGDDVIESVTIARKRDHPYVPTTLPLVAPAPPPSSQPISVEPIITPAATAPDLQVPSQTQPQSP